MTTPAANAAPPRLSWNKIGILTVLYLVQGLPFGFLIGTFPMFLKSQGMSLAKITFISVVNFPWLIKFLWAPLADKYFFPKLGRRRSWIIPAQAALIVALIVTGLLSPSLSLLGLMAMLSLVNFCAATQDIAVDGLAVDILDEHERGVGNSVQAAAYKIGMIGGGYGLTAYFTQLGIQGCFYVMAAAVAVAMLVPIFLREPPPPPLVSEAESQHRHTAVLSLIMGLFTRQGAVVFLLMVVLSKAGDSIANPLFRLFLLDRKLTWDQVNLSMNIGGMIATLVGSAICGFVIMRLGRRHALWMTILGQGLSHLGWAVLAAWGLSLTSVWGIALVEHFVSGMLTVVIFTLMMDAVRPEVGSAQYTLLMSIYIGVGFGLGLVAGSVAQFFGWQVAFGVAGVSTLCCLFLVVPLDRLGYLDGKRPELPAG
ncbi:MAG: MFS transporter [bacterium]